ncbi:helix-turn-helix transcriptional regulator [Actinomycetospora flava]|uniref:Helix-turn-helix domain-containing protein n=1 Tax=Actinomycetospora flava TaxID=3129232 RepID=A0ABU8LZJ3_9PSEU
MSTDAGPLERLLTSREVSEIIGVPDNTLRDWRCDAVGPPFIRIGRGGRNQPVRYRLRDLERWLDERTVRTEARP